MTITSPNVDHTWLEADSTWIGEICPPVPMPGYCRSLILNSFLQRLCHGPCCSAGAHQDQPDSVVATHAYTLPHPAFLDGCGQEAKLRPVVLTLTALTETVPVG